MINYPEQLSNLRSVLRRKQEAIPLNRAEWVETANSIGLDPGSYDEPDYQALLDLIQELESRELYPELIISFVRGAINSRLKDKSDEEIRRNQVLWGYKNMSSYFNAYLEGKDF